MADVPDAALRGRAGFTLMEVMAASVIVAVVAGGTMMSLVAAARMTASQDHLTHAEASALAQESIEKFRNDGVDAMNPMWLADQVPLGWQADSIVVGAGGSESKLDLGTAKRCYRVVEADCDGVGGVGDCYGMQSRVCWNDVADCPC